MTTSERKPNSMCHLYITHLIRCNRYCHDTSTQDSFDVSK